jgi:hypothetical protein
MKGNKSMAIMQSRFTGSKCKKCGATIQAGQYISWARRGANAGTYHVDCSNPNNRPADAIPPTPVQTPANVDAPVRNTDNPAYKAYLADEPSEPISEPTPASASKDVLGSVLAEAIKPFFTTTINREQLREAIADGTKGFATQDMLADMAATLEKIALQSRTLSIEVKSAETVRRIDGAHESMPELLYILSKRHHAYLYGGPGSGKTYAAKQCSEALGLDYGYISLNPQTPDSRLLGFMDANGNYRETVFYNLYKNGGVFCIDEVDNASPSLLTTLNSALENGHAAFPCGMIERHKDFVLVATGNTCGRGANPMFPERRPFDAAFAERFTFLNWEYDTNLETAIVRAINPADVANDWLNWIRKVRADCKTRFPRVIVSPRASFKGAEYLKDSGWPVAHIAENVLFKGLDVDTVKAILSANPLPSVKASKVGV